MDYLKNKKMKAYIQTKENGDWLHENCYSSAEGFHRMGYDIVKFELKDTEQFNGYIEFRDFDIRDDVAHGGVKAMRNLFDKFEVPQPKIDNPHEHLLKYTGRTFGHVKYKDIVKEFSSKHTVDLTPIFIKPLTEHKLFTGFVVTHFSDLIKTAHIDPETDILTSSVSNFISEYRCFVRRRSLVGIKNYTGDFFKIPDSKIVYDAINNYDNQPLAYSLDFGITEGGETQLIEINDGFALGAYGLNSIYYCQMIRDRWHQIINTKA